MTCARSHYLPGQTLNLHRITMFQKDTLDTLFAELEISYGQSSEYEQLLRETHLGIALSDAGRDFDEQVDQRVAALIDKHRDDG